MKTLSLGAFIESVKSEILDYQEKHEGERALFHFEEVELEAVIGTTMDANGKVNVFAVQFGADAKQESSHRVRIKFSMADPATRADFGRARGPAVGLTGPVKQVSGIPPVVTPYGGAAAADPDAGKPKKPKLP